MHEPVRDLQKQQLATLFSDSAIRSAIQLGSRYDEDVEGDVWLRIVRKVDCIPDDATPGYFYRMARRVHVDRERRDQGRREKRELYTTSESYESSTERDIDIRRFFERSTETTLEDLSLDEIAIQVATGFDFESRMIWLMAWEGHRQSSIARIIGRSKSYVSKALKSIRDQLRDGFENPPAHD